MVNEPLVLVAAVAEAVLGEYTHSIEFPADDEYMIVYGPNGVGKTKFLEIVHAVSSMDAQALSRAPFERATLRYSNGTTISAAVIGAQSPNAPSQSPIPRVQFRLTLPEQPEVVWENPVVDLEEWLIENTTWRPAGGRMWEDRIDGEVLHIGDLAVRFAGDMVSPEDMPASFQHYKERVSSYLIETQRLKIQERAPYARNFPARRRGMEKSSSRISGQAKKMQELVSEAQTSHSRITQQLDRTFPNRVLGAADSGVVDDATVRARYNDQNEFRSRLGRVVSVALEEALSLPDRSLEPWELKLLGLYLADADKKLEPFEGLLQKIELLESIVNARLLRKRLQVTATEGLRITHEDAGREIDLDSLSSGEQHEIILLFDLLFSVPPGSIVLVDEPEISLHVAWQLSFIPDVRKIAELAGFRFIVATHSPQIVNDSWSRAVRLGPDEAEFS
ncbi:AAA family ATPase [Janibacter hoylei]|uniref:AAA family ATPase n=1 Tax=Janibacter hoylei TaxID=364298 RepID=UPI0021A684CB|nr:AAA family ATPase [Janibacter hoylei]MCT1617587.1 AAA family ATPase [Janibacter hoylei]MCT2292802.1 AAA family ATPase [Janibacter hoylei]